MRFIENNKLLEFDIRLSNSQSSTSIQTEISQLFDGLS